MTLAFDFSIEEVWPTFAAGATLVAGPTDHRRLGAGLTDFLIEQEITVLCCVPTLLATVERDVPTLRTLLVGGEACPADLVKRWSRPGRRMLNTYGPTETTVTATWAELVPDKPVTIGRPLPTYTVHILDEELRPVPPGEAGEICIGGPGVAVGYVNRPELTAEKFVPDPFCRSSRARGCIAPATSAASPSTARSSTSAASTPRSRFAATASSWRRSRRSCWKTPRSPTPWSRWCRARAACRNWRPTSCCAAPCDFARPAAAAARRRCGSGCPAYMVPAFIELLDAIPMLPSDKADRSRLPRPAGPRLAAGDGDGDEVPPETPLEREIAAAWAQVFGHEISSVEADFFLDLGGHSLFAAQVVSDLRRKPPCVTWASPTCTPIRPSAAWRGTSRGTCAPDRPGCTAGAHAAPRQHRRVWSGGAVADDAALSASSFPWLAPTSLVVVLLADERAVARANCVAVRRGLMAAAPLLALLLPVAAKWLLLGRVRPGRYPLWGWFFCRWWLVRKLLQTAPLDYLAGSPLLAPYLRLLGARIGRGCHLGSARIDVPDLIEIGDGASIGYDVDLDPEPRRRRLAAHRPGAHRRRRLCRHQRGRHRAAARSAAARRVVEQSLVATGQTIPGGRNLGRLAAAAHRLRSRSSTPWPRVSRRRSWPPLVLAGFVLGFLLLELLPSLLLVPGLVLVWGVSGGDLWLGLALTPGAGLFYVLFTCARGGAGQAAGAAVRSGRASIPLRSAFGLRKWLADRLMILQPGTDELAVLHAVPAAVPAAARGTHRAAGGGVHGVAHRPGPADAGAGVLRGRPGRGRGGAVLQRVRRAGRDGGRRAQLCRQRRPGAGRHASGGTTA